MNLPENTIEQIAKLRREIFSLTEKARTMRLRLYYTEDEDETLLYEYIQLTTKRDNLEHLINNLTKQPKTLSGQS